MADAEKPDRLKGFASSTAAITTMLSFVIGLPSLILTWNNQGNERARAFAQAIEQEENRWNRLYELYYVALAEEAAGKPAKLVEARLQAVCRLASKPVTDFAAFPLGTFFPESGTEQHKAEKARMVVLRNGLTGMLLDEKRSSEQTVKCVQDQLADQLATQTAARPREAVADAKVQSGASPPPAVIAAAVQQTKSEVSMAGPSTAGSIGGPAPDPSSQPASVTLSAGRPNGWDIDVFWCEGQNAKANLSAASEAAGRLTAARARSVLIGRVRLRMLSLERQSDSGYRPLGLEVRGEAREQKVALRLAQELSSAGATFQYRPSTQVTKWYLSAFVCQP